MTSIDPWTSSLAETEMCFVLYFNKLKSLKVAQVKDELDGDEHDGCDVVYEEV